MSYTPITTTIFSQMTTDFDANVLSTITLGLGAHHRTDLTADGDVFQHLRSADPVVVLAGSGTMSRSMTS